MSLFYRLFLVGILLFLLGHHSAGQSQTGVSGQCLDPARAPLPFVNLALRRAEDSVVVKLSVSNTEGRFSIVPVPGGTYFVEGSLVGFRRFRSPVFSLAAGQNQNLGDLLFEPRDKTLKEVQVLATKPLVIMEPDKMVVRVEDNPLMVNSNALEVLRKSPGVIVNQDDQIFLQGKSGLQVYIDGRPSPLSDKDLANWLRTLPSSQIESVELITQPSAKFDASGNAGIINIRLKKNQKRGFNGSLVSGISNGLATEHNYFKQNHGLNLNFGGGKVNLFGSYGYDQGKSWSFMDIYRIQSEQIFDQNTNTFDRRQGHTAKVGADWMVSKRHVLSAMTDWNQTDTRSEVESGNFIYRLGSSRPYTLLEAGNFGDRTNQTANFNLGHQYRDTSGTEIATDANYGWYKQTNRTRQPNFYRNFSPDSSLEDRSFGLDTPVDIFIATLKTDLEKKFGSSSASFGYKISDVRTQNDFSLFDQSWGQNDLDKEQSSSFSYLERVVAGYVSFRHSFSEKWKVQAGLRYEHTHSEGQLEYRTGAPDSLVPRNYGNFFPSAGISFTLNKAHSFGLSYSKRIDRPVYRFLNPFQYKLDELSYEQGNPFLNPQFTHSVQLSHTLFSAVNSSVSFSQTNDFFARVIDSLGSRSFLTRRNLSRVRTYSFNLSTPLPIRKWWNGFFNFTFNHQEYEADFGDGKRLFIPVDYFSLYMQHSLSLPHGYSLQGSWVYSSPNVWGGTFRNRAFWFVEIGGTKKVFNGKGVISFSITDVFLSQRWKGKSDFAGVNITVQGGSDSRLAKLGFTWNFGQAEIRQLRRKTGNAEEKQRLRGD